MKLGHAQPQVIVLALLALLASGALGYWLFSQLSLPDPAAAVRKKYAESKMLQPGTIVSPGEPLHKPPVESPASLQVQKSAPGNIVSAVPDDIARVRHGTPVEEKPAVQVPPLTTSPVYLTPLPSASPAGQPLPPVPQQLLDQTPPESGSRDYAGPTPVQIRVQPRRYLFNNLSPAAIEGKTVQVHPDDQHDYNPETFAPVGEDITLALMNNVASNSFEVPVAAGVWEPFYFQGHLLLKIGDKIIGTAQAGKNRDRILVNFSRIILKDGRSLAIQATALAPDGTIGIRGFTIGQNLLQTLTPVLLEAVRGFAEVFQDRADSTSSGILGTTTTLGNDLQTKGIEAGRGALEKISDIIAQDLEENRPYILAVAGTLCRARLLQPLDVSVADYGK